MKKLILPLLLFIVGCGTENKPVEPYAGKVVAKDDTKYDIENHFLAPSKVVYQRRVQIARDQDGWKKWFKVTAEEYDNVEIGYSVAMVDGKLAIDPIQSGKIVAATIILQPADKKSEKIMKFLGIEYGEIVNGEFRLRAKYLTSGFTYELDGTKLTMKQIGERRIQKGFEIDTFYHRPCEKTFGSRTIFAGNPHTASGGFGNLPPQTNDPNEELDLNG